MNKSLIFFLILLTIFSYLFLFNCSAIQRSSTSLAGNGDDQDLQYNQDEIEKLLGITPEEAAIADEKQFAQKDSLKQTGDLIPKIRHLRTLIESVIKDNKSKDSEIAELKSQLNLRDAASNLATKSKSSVKDSQNLMDSSPLFETVRTSNQYNPSSYKAEYNRGLASFHQKNYSEAISVFEHLLSIDTQNDYADNAQYWKGEANFALKRYQKAIVDFEKVFTFQKSNKNDYAQYKIAQCYYILGNKSRANQEFQNFLDNYPNSELISNARRYISQL